MPARRASASSAAVAHPARRSRWPRPLSETGDHRPERRPLGGVGQPVADLAQVGHEQHRLDDAGGTRSAVRREAVQPSVGVDQRRTSRPRAARAGSAARPATRAGGREGRARRPSSRQPRAGPRTARARPRFARARPRCAASSAPRGRVETGAVALAGPLEARRPGNGPGSEREAETCERAPRASRWRDHPARAVAHAQVRDRPLDVHAARALDAVIARASRGSGLRRGATPAEAREHDAGAAATRRTARQHAAARYGCPYRRRARAAVALSP